ncbi:MAG: dienelactone hydrolase family protein [Saprospiraceae bacterium]|nr:dienelactone hydrolase family protein [Saprospiraceae bacterium]
MKQIRNLFAALIVVATTAIACEKETLQPQNPQHNTEVDYSPPQSNIIHLRSGSSVNTQTVTFTNASGLTLSARLVTPNNIQPNEKLPAMVILHGCGGMWSNDNPANGMKNNFNEWASEFSARRIVALFIDSYVPRNLVEFCEKNPTNDTICSPAYERTKDPYAGLAYLKTLSYVDGSRIGMMGFSHGGSTALSAIVDAPYVTKSLWTVSYKIDSTTTFKDTVSAPVAKPTTGGFKTAIAYYPGAGFFGYYGSTTDYKVGKYRNYAPTLILGAAKDPLLPATRVLKDKAVYHNGQTIELVEYANANHSFDEATTSGTDDFTAKEAARTKVWSWLTTNL